VKCAKGNPAGAEISGCMGAEFFGNATAAAISTRSERNKVWNNVSAISMCVESPLPRRRTGNLYELHPMADRGAREYGTYKAAKKHRATSEVHGDHMDEAVACGFARLTRAEKWHPPR